MQETKSAAKKPLGLRQGKIPSELITAKNTLALGISVLMMTNMPAMAEETTSEEATNLEPIGSEPGDAARLETVKVEGHRLDTNPYAEQGAPYKAKISGDNRHVRDLAETPQTISVLTQIMIEESGREDIRDILVAQPGVTLGTGENGNAFGDRYIIRGHEARSDVFVDGLHDPGMTTRESFATEQVEITKGPSSTFAGRGSTGGAINSITKQAGSAYDFSKIKAGIGTDDYRRITLDTNKRLGDNAALRLNLLHSYQEIPDRAPGEKERNGFALSGSFQATENLDFLADVYYLDAKDKPDLGTYIDRTTGNPNSNIPVYLQDEDFLESEVKTFTFRAGLDVSSHIRIENATRYGTTDNGYVVTGASGSTRDSTDLFAPGASTITLSTHQGWQEVEHFVNQFNIFFDHEIANMQHEFIVGLEYSDLKVKNGVYNVSNTGTTNCTVAGRRGVSQGYCAIDGNGNTTANLDELMGRNIIKGNVDSDFNIDTISLSVMDTIDINEHWSTFLGVRYDKFNYKNDIVGRGASTPTAYKYSDGLWNGHVGLVYKFNERGNVYLTYSTASNINGGESDLGGNCGYGGICGANIEEVKDSKPEDTTNIELGTKWQFNNEKLLLTASIFQITKDDVMESVGSAYATLGTLNTGKNRVSGVEISLMGNLTDKLSTQFGMSYMESEILKSFRESNEGGVLANFADESLFLQMRYQMTPKFSYGGIVTAKSEMYAGQPDSAAGSIKIPSYTVVDLFANYSFSDNLNARLNIGNVLDKDYYLAAYRSGSFTYIGDARNAHLTLNYTF